MSLTNPKTSISEQDLKDFYDKIKPFLAPKTYAGFTPIGTIISVFGETAPANYLICDGSTYNVADYPELCAHLWNLTTNSQYKVSGDATKFKVPDLRGEFLRGTGTNGHTDNQDNCSGSNVGVHQDATGVLAYQFDDRNNDQKIDITRTIKGKLNNPINGDGYVGTSESKDDIYRAQIAVTSYTKMAFDTAQRTRFTTRPTNTSVLFCIATKNIYLDPKNDYSTEEKVIGTWIDGKTLYQKTVHVTEASIAVNTIKYINLIDNVHLVNSYGTVDFVVNSNQTKKALNCSVYNDAGTILTLRTDVYEDGGVNKIRIRVLQGVSSTIQFDFYVTVQYTKTT